MGLIRVREFRRKGIRDEAIYEVVSDRLVIEKDNSNPAYVQGLVKTVRVALRKAEQEHAEARGKADSELFAILRLHAYLTAGDAVKLRKKTKDLGTWMRKRYRSASEPDSEGVALTCVVIPTGKQN